MASEEHSQVRRTLQQVIEGTGTDIVDLARGAPMELTGTEFESLQMRVQRLERQNCWMKRAGGGVLLLLAVVVTMGQSRQPRTVEAEQFILRDTQGRVRLTIGTPRVSGAALDTGSDEPALWLIDTNGTDRAILTGDGLRFADEKARPLRSYTAATR